MISDFITEESVRISPKHLNDQNFFLEATFLSSTFEFLKYCEKASSQQNDVSTLFWMTTKISMKKI